jgi:solute:Na+ symporter, SSS family
MHWIDLTVFVVYLVAMLGVGAWFLKRNSSADDYYVGGRNLSPFHVGLSVVATDVGGGFSIGLGGLGFTMGLSGSWLLFTGLIGAWMAAVLLIPRVSRLAQAQRFLTFPQLLGHYYGSRVALAAGIVSAIGYWGFSSSQFLAGAKLASASFQAVSLHQALLVMGVIAVAYTVMGGIKAVIYTDTVQWILLMGGLIFIGLPLGYQAVGGIEAIRQAVAPEMLTLTHIAPITLLNWAVTIIPIWFVGMTLYQRIYACKGPNEARKAWFIAGLFEWPVMAFMGVCLGLFARVAAEQGMFQELLAGPTALMDPELGLPLLLRSILPVGLLGLMLSAYFSAIMSTADSCMMAASGNIMTDIFGTRWAHLPLKNQMKISRWVTFVIGAVAILLAWTMENVLELMLYSYAFMVSGLLVPVVAAVFFKMKNPHAALAAMGVGGSTTLALILAGVSLPFGLDANVFGISASVLTFILVTYYTKTGTSKRNNYTHHEHI